MAHKKKKTIKKIIAYLLVAAITVVITSTIYYNQYTTIIIPYDYITTDYVGFNGDKDLLHFGAGIPGSTLEREIILQSTEPTLITIITDQSYISSSKNNFILEPTTPQAITFYVLIQQQPQGNYTGTILIREKKVHP